MVTPTIPAVPTQPQSMNARLILFFVVLFLASCDLSLPSSKRNPSTIVDDPQFRTDWTVNILNFHLSDLQVEIIDQNFTPIAKVTGQLIIKSDKLVNADFRDVLTRLSYQVHAFEYGLDHNGVIEVGLFQEAGNQLKGSFLLEIVLPRYGFTEDDLTFSFNIVNWHPVYPGYLITQNTER